MHGLGCSRISCPSILHMEGGTPQSLHSPPGPQKPAQNPTHPRCKEPPCTTAVVLWEAGGGILTPGSHCSHGDAGEPPIHPSSRGPPAGMRQPLGPGGVGEGDVVEAGPAGKDPLLSDKAVVIAPAAPLVVDVGCALIGALRLVVVVGQAAGWGTAAAVGKETSGEPHGGVMVLGWGLGGLLTRSSWVAPCHRHGRRHTAPPRSPW